MDTQKNVMLNKFSLVVNVIGQCLSYFMIRGDARGCIKKEVVFFPRKKETRRKEKVSSDSMNQGKLVTTNREGGYQMATQCEVLKDHIYEPRYLDK